MSQIAPVCLETKPSTLAVNFHGCPVCHLTTAKLDTSVQYTTVKLPEEASASPTCRQVFVLHRITGLECDEPAFDMVWDCSRRIPSIVSIRARLYHQLIKIDWSTSADLGRRPGAFSGLLNAIAHSSIERMKRTRLPTRYREAPSAPSERRALWLADPPS
jgi:hypothetical protein